MFRCSITSFLSFILTFFIFTAGCSKYARSYPATQASEDTFELKDGDRVLLLGNSLMERDHKYGYIEFILTTRWPDRDISFRNLGWSGDTVFGDARSYYTTPPKPYDLLIQQIKDAEPTIVFIGYGANEAYEGKEGVSKFIKGLNRLLDEIEALNAEAVLLSPIPQSSDLVTKDELIANNRNLKLYTSAISAVASKRNKKFIDLFKAFQEVENYGKLVVDDIHLNESGYYYLSSIIERELELSPRKWDVTADITKNVTSTYETASITKSTTEIGDYRFTIDDAILPLPPPNDAAPIESHMRVFNIKGLDSGYYTLTINKENVTTATAEDWASGVHIKNGAAFKQANKLRNLITQKNSLYFRKYRPHNRIYLVGFRSYEQGQNADELEQLDLFVSKIEDQIFQLRRPTQQVYRIKAVK